jgi:hypothetical protein
MVAEFTPPHHSLLSSLPSPPIPGVVSVTIFKQVLQQSTYSDSPALSSDYIWEFQVQMNLGPLTLGLCSSLYSFEVKL